MPTSAVGGLLALLLLGATVCSASHALHQALHPERAGHDHLCLACALAKGQVSAAAVVPVAAVLTCCFLGNVRLLNLLPLAGFDYRVSLSRAPPLT